MARVERVEFPSAGTVVGLIRVVALLAAAWVSLASITTESGSEEGWSVGDSIEPPTVELNDSESLVGHFTFVRRNASVHDLESRIELALTYTGSPDTVFVVVSVVPDMATSRISFGSSSPFPLIPDAPADDHVRRGIDLDATCTDECIDGFSVYVERVSGSAEGTVTVDWAVLAGITAYEGDEPDGVEFDVRLDP